MNVTVLYNHRCDQIDRIDAAVRDLGVFQSFFRLSTCSVKWLPNDPAEEDMIPPEPLRAEIERRHPGQPVLAVTQSGFDPDLFVNEYRNVSLISTAWWDSEYAPPPLKVYLWYQFASAFINFAADLTDEMIDGWAHRPEGCIFDVYENPQGLKRCMTTATICGRCETKLAQMEMPDGALRAIEQILDRVRKAMVRRARATPLRVFIGHGHSRVWLALRAYLREELHVDVEEFNEQPAAGVAIHDRLAAMLDHSAAALLVFTGENRDSRGRFSHARENVIHEAGLFQGRLGFDRAVILREQGVAGFSNLDGMNVIQFPRGRLNDKAKREVREKLHAWGLLAAKQD
jgi:predicted nucleotide-binding protein